MFVYGNTISTDVDDCRYSLFISGKYGSDAFPPNSDCLIKRNERANLQAACLSQSLTPQQKPSRDYPLQVLLKTNKKAIMSYNWTDPVVLSCVEPIDKVTNISNPSLRHL